MLGQSSSSALPSIERSAKTHLAEALHLSRNPVATLGWLGQVPVLDNWHNVVLRRDGAGCFAPNLAEYANLSAVREVSSMGVFFGLEARDVSGMVFERILLAGRGRHELFEQFVTVHQSPPEEAGNWFPPNHALSARRRASIVVRIPWLRFGLANGAKNVRPLPIEFVPQLLVAAARMNFPIPTTHYNRALIRAAVWTPRLQESNTEAESPLEFFHGNGVGLHQLVFDMNDTFTTMTGQDQVHSNLISILPVNLRTALPRTLFQNEFVSFVLMQLKPGQRLHFAQPVLRLLMVGHDRQQANASSVIAGAGIAFMATIITWFIAVGIISNLTGSVSALNLHTATGLLAVIVLLVIMDWFFHKIYWGGWMTMHNRRKKNLIESATDPETSKTSLLWGLGLLGFTSLYREGFEVVFFLQSYYLRMGGALLGLFFFGIISVLTFLAHRKLPYRKMLILTDIMLGVVLLVMVGEQAQEMQLAHWIPPKHTDRSGG